MKIRKGFVSNSSSSSFIIAADSKEVKTTITMEVDISRFTNDIITTKEDLIAYIEDIYCVKIEELEGERYAKEIYEKCLKALDEGKVIYSGSASYNETDDPIELMIGNGGLQYINNIEIISDDC